MRERDQQESTNPSVPQPVAADGEASGHCARLASTIVSAGAISVSPVSQRQRPAARSELEAAFFRALAATARPFAAVGSSGIVLHWSAGAHALLGYVADDVVGQSLAATLPALEEGLGTCRGLRSGESVTFTAHALHRSGFPLTVAVCAIPAVNEGGEVLGLLLDLQPAAQALPEAASQPAAPASRALGAELQHDLNNVLAAVQVYAGFVASSSLSPRQSADLEVALAAARHGASLLNAVGKWDASGALQASSAAAVIDVKDVVCRADEALRRAVGPGVEVSIQLPLVPLPVRSSAEKIESLLLSLALNARDAMDGVGALSLALSSAAVGPADPLAGKVPAGSHAVISVRDTGTGMSPETQARIFDPFFTGKPRNQGGGLGLAVARAAVEGLGGAILVHSELGGGSEFQVFLPLAIEAADPPRSAAPKPSLAATVLIIDDDAALRSGLRRVLEAEGYDVLEAADGTEAADVSARHPGPIQLLLSDLTLPGADGRDALARVRSLRPDIRALFVSGRLDTSRPLPRGAEFVQKPFATSELLAAMARVMASASPRAGRLISKKPIVLIVDDDEALREAFGRVIEECEFQALRAKSGLHALQVLEQQHVDVVICDQFMPGMDGVQLLEVVRERYPQLLRILFTAFPSSDIVLEAVNRGGVHKVLVKSMQAVAIRDEVERAVLASDRFRASHRPG